MYTFATVQYVLYSNVVCVIEMERTVPRVGLKPTFLAFRASVLPLHHVGFPDVTSTLPTLTCLCSLRVQCRRLQNIQM